MSGKIIKLEPENYVKCSNIWNMEKNPGQTQRWYEELLSGNRVIFVYAVDGEYLGEAALVFDNGDSDYTIENRRVYLSRMIVKPECRNNGIGGLLIDYLMDYAKNLGYAEMSLGVDIVNVGARWLYEKKGFTSIIFVGEDKYGKYVKLLKTL
jgi:Acetyltransferases